MTKKLARLLRADIQETSDLKSIAKTLAGKGRGGDTLLAHITPKEVELLKEAGGAGTVNPDTGLLEFYDWSGDGGIVSGYDGGGSTTAAAGGGYYDSLPAATPGVYGKDASSDYYYPEAPAAPAAPAVPDYSQYATGMADFPFQAPPQAPAAAPAIAKLPGYTEPVIASVGERGTQEIVPTPPTLSQRAGDVLSAIKSGGGDVLDYLKKNPELLKLGTSGIGALLTAQKAKQGAQQVQQATTEQKKIASPYQALGAEAQRAAMAGELTPQGAQSLQAARAQLNQGIESRGGVGVAQAQAQLENLRQNLLQQQMDYGIKLSSIGDNIAIGAIRTGLQADQAVNQLTNSMYTNMLAIASGLSPQPARTATQGVTT